MNKIDKDFVKASIEAQDFIQDLVSENEYLKRVLIELVCQIQEDIAPDAATEHFWNAVQDAEEALGYQDQE